MKTDPHQRSSLMRPAIENMAESLVQHVGEPGKDYEMSLAVAGGIIGVHARDGHKQCANCKANLTRKTAAAIVEHLQHCPPHH